MKVGQLIRRQGSEILYRVTEVLKDGCRVEAIENEVQDVVGRAARPVHYSEKRFRLVVTDAGLIDDSWRGWKEVA